MAEAALIVNEIENNVEGYKERLGSVILSEFAMSLYGDDFKSLREDVAKIVLMEGSCYKANKNERFNLLRALFSGFTRYCDDVSFLLNECERQLADHEEVKDEDDDDLPFT